MKKFPSCLFLLCLGVLLFAQGQPGGGKPADSSSQAIPLVSVQMTPGLNIPLGESSPVFGLGGAVLLGAEYRLPFLPLLYVSGSAGYDYDTAIDVPLSVSVASVRLGTGLRFDLLPWLSMAAGVSGGYFFSILSDLSAMAGNPFLSAEAEATLLPSPWHVTLERCGDGI